MYLNNDLNYLKELKRKEVYIFGAAKIGETVMHQLESNQIPVKAFIDNNANKKEFQGKKVISLKEWMKLACINKLIVIAAAVRSEYEIRKQLNENNIYQFISRCQIDFGGGLSIMTSGILRFRSQ